jgi:hypothetical protein
VAYLPLYLKFLAILCLVYLVAVKVVATLMLFLLLFQ